mmetsp:Transcript_1367/g.2862  ORF Transcript_1367/g.2862 Transcript_1367/m.2862 type:complete len:681 (-) Transcript_1367:32-2074(-)
MNHTTSDDNNKRNWKVGDGCWGDAAATRRTTPTIVNSNETVRSLDDTSGARAASSPPVSAIPAAVLSGATNTNSDAPIHGSFLPSPRLKREQEPSTLIGDNVATSTSSNRTTKTEPSEDHDRNTSTNAALPPSNTEIVPSPIPTRVSSLPLNVASSSSATLPNNGDDGVTPTTQMEATIMSDNMVRTRNNPTGRGTMKRFATMNEPKQSMKTKSSLTRQKGNTTPTNKAKKRMSSITEKRMMKTVRNQRLENTDIPQIENNNMGSQASNELYTSSSDSSVSEKESDGEPMMSYNNRVDYEVSKAYKTSINSNLSDNTITLQQIHIEISILKDQMKKIMEGIERLEGRKQMVRKNQSIVSEDVSNRVNTEMMSPTVSKALKDSKVFTTNALRAFIKDKYYPTIKFDGKEKEQAAILLKAIKVGGVQVPNGVTKREFRNYFVPHVPSCFNRLRSNSQTLCQKNWRADTLKGLVPESFPGTLGLVDDPNNEGEVMINPGYRNYSIANNDEFCYFVRRILPAINPKKLNFGKDCVYKKISEMFSVSDEAFALLVLYNELHVWKENMKQGDQPIDSEENSTDQRKRKKKRKRFCDPMSGRKQGWELKGKRLYNKLCNCVSELRENVSTGVIMEQNMMEVFRMENGGDIQNTERTSVENEREEQQEYRTEADRKALAMVADSEWDE